jgi:AcrR family transcriptional regulator
VSEEITIPDTGSTRRDILALMRDAVELYSSSLPARLMPHLVSAIAQKPVLAHAVRSRFLAGRRAALREVLGRGIERGDLRPDLDLELALDVLAGPLFYRLLITGGPIDEQLAEGVTDLILRGFAPDERRRQKSQKARKETAQ